MKKLLMTAVAVALTSSAFAAPPSVAFVKELNVGPFITVPTGVAIYNGAIFVNEFGAAAGTRRILKITNPLSGSPTFTTFATPSVSFPINRGLQAMWINQANGDIWSFGDDQTNGNVFRYDQSATLLDSVSTSGNRIVGGMLWGSDPDLVVARVASSSLTELPTTPLSATTESTSALALTPVNANFRDVCVIGNDVYYSRNGTTSDAVAKFTGGTAGDWATYGSTQPNTAFLTLSGTNAVAAFGIDSYVHTASGTTYIVVPDITAAAVKFADVADASVDVTVTTPLTTGIRDVCVGAIGSSGTFLLVSQTSGTNPNTVQVFGIDGATAVSDWTQY